MADLDTRTVPLVDLAWQHAEIAREVRSGWDRVLADTSFILGPQVREFEDAYAEYVGVSHCVGVGSGTDAIEIALRAVGVGPGDEVILPANTFIATALAVTRAGATPVLVDCDPRFHLIDVEQVGNAITANTRAVIPVHLYGQMAPVAEMREAFPDLWIIEDGAQSQGATRGGAASGSVGHLGATSFYPGKNIGAYGDAGAVTTDDDALASAVEKLRNWGSDVKYHHPEKGFNSRLDTLQAVVLSAKLEKLEAWNSMRRQAAARYEQRLAELSVGLPETAPGNEHVWHLYVISVDDRDGVLSHLHDSGVGAGIHYPVPIHLQGAYGELGSGPGSFPNAERLAHTALSLPLFPGISESDQEYVVARLEEALA